MNVHLVAINHSVFMLGLVRRLVSYGVQDLGIFLKTAKGQNNYLPKGYFVFTPLLFSPVDNYGEWFAP